MKILISVLLAASTGFAAAYFFVSGSKGDSTSKAEYAKAEAQWHAEKAELETALAAAKNKKPKVEQIKTEVPVATKRSAKEILANLLKLQPSGTTRIYTIRKIVHELEDLAELQDEAVPDIRQFLAQNSDLDYSVESDRSSNGDRRGWTPPWQRSNPPTEFTLPPSLRIGLFDVLKDINSAESIALMGEVLGNSGRAVEVAYLTRALEEVAPGKYRETALTAAKDMLRNPIAINSPNRLDEQAEGYLFGILELYNDGSFVEDAKKMLVNAEGRIDRNAQQYLAKFNGEGMIATYYDLFKSNTMTNGFDKMSIANRILDYVGPNAQANKFLAEVVGDTNIDSRMRSFAVMRLAGGFPGGNDTTKDPNVARQQIPVLENLKATTTDERILKTIESTQQNLQNIVDGKPVENPYDRFRGGGGGPDGGRRNRDGATQTPQPN